MVQIRTPIVGKAASNLQELCPKNVFSVLTNKKNKELAVEREDQCSMCRACVSHPDLEGKVFLGKERKNFYLTIETVGVVRPIDIFIRAMDVLRQKCEFYEAFFKTV